MTRKFNTAQEFKALPEEERKAVAQSVIDNGNGGIIDYSLISSEMARIEDLAYAIGDEILLIANTDEEQEYEAREALNDFMSTAAEELNMDYGGEYRDHEDGFWVSSNCY